MNDHLEEDSSDFEDAGGMKESNNSFYLRPTDTAKFLKQFIWQEFEISRMVFGWVPAVPEFEMKGSLCRYGYIHSKNTKGLYDRMKELPGTLNEREDTPKIIRIAFERISLAPDTASFFVGYRTALNSIFTGYDQLIEKLDDLLDMPTMDQLNIILMGKKNQLEWLNNQTKFAHTEDSIQKTKISKWAIYVQNVCSILNDALQRKLVAADIEWPIYPDVQAAGPVPAKTMWNEEEFPKYTPPNQPIKAYDDPDLSPLYDNIKQMHYINATEMAAAESLCYLYYGVHDMPLAFYFDLARHIWDESRHSMMGVRRLKQLGYSTRQFKFSRADLGNELNTLAKEWFPDMYAGLTMVAEPCSFIKKRKSAERFWQYGDALSAIHCEFDMADERMHVDFGKKWGPELYKRIDDLITAAEMSERARIRRLEQLGETMNAVEARKIAKNFPGFCGLSTVELNYNNY